jgi:hypothetical protein
MPVSRYDNPAEYDPMMNRVSTYVPLPFEELALALGTRQRTHDTNLAQVNQQEANVLGIKSIREHEPARKKFVEDVNSQFTQLLEKYPDASSPEFTREKDRIIKQLASDQRIPIFQRSIDAQKKQLDLVEDLRKQGKYGAYNDPYATGFQGLDDSGNPIEYQFKPIDASQDHTTPVYNLFDKIKPSGAEREAFTFDQSGNIIGVKKGYEGIGQQFIKNVTKQNIDTFLDTPEGQDFARKMYYYGEDDVHKAAEQYMNNIGQAYLFGKGKESTDFKYAPQYVAEGLQDQALLGQAPITNTTATTNPLQPTKIETNENGDIVNYSYQGQPITKERYDELAQASSLNAAHGGKGLEGLSKNIVGQNDSITDPKIKSIVDNYKTIYKKNISAKEAVALYNKAADKSGLVILKHKNFTPKRSDALTNQVLGGKNTIQGLQGRELAVIGPNGSKPVTVEELTEELGITVDNPITGSKVQGRMLYHPQFPGAYNTVITTKDGKSYEIAVGASDQEKSYFGRYLNPVSQAALSGQDVDFELDKGVKVKTTTVPTEEGFKTQVTVTTPNGTENMSLEEYSSRIHDKFERSQKSLFTAGYGTTKEYNEINTGEEAE